MRKNKSVLSVVIPSYLAEKTISRTLASIFESGLDIEVIVVEDGQLDNTANIVHTKFPEARLISYENNLGGCYARNLGLAKAQSNYVMFLDADDYVLPNFLAGLLEAIELEDSDICFGRCTKVWENGNSIVSYQPRLETNEEVIIRWLLGDSGPGTCSVLWKKSSLELIGGWNEALRRNQDGELVLRAMFKGLRLSFSNISSSVYWQHSQVRVSNSPSYQALESLLLVKDQVQTWIENYSGPYERALYNSFRAYEIEIFLKLSCSGAPHDLLKKAETRRWLPKYSLYNGINKKTFLRHVLIYFFGVKLFLLLRNNLKTT